MSNKKEYKGTANVTVLDVETFPEDPGRLTQLDPSIDYTSALEAVLTDKDKSLSQKLDFLDTLIIKVVGDTFKPYFGMSSGGDVVKYSFIIKQHLEDIRKNLIERSKFENSLEVDFYNPKIQKAFSFIIKTIFAIMEDMEVDFNNRIELAEKVGSSLFGIEDVLNEMFKGIAGTFSTDAENPVLKAYLKGKKKGFKKRKKKEIEYDDDYFEKFEKSCRHKVEAMFYFISKVYK